MKLYGFYTCYMGKEIWSWRVVRYLRYKGKEGIGGLAVCFFSLLFFCNWECTISILLKGMYSVRTYKYSASRVVTWQRKEGVAHDRSWGSLGTSSEFLRPFLPSKRYRVFCRLLLVGFIWARPLSFFFFFTLFFGFCPSPSLFSSLPAFPLFLIGFFF